MKALSLAFTFYKNPLMLAEQYRIWSQYPPEVEIIVADDGSPKGFRAEEVPGRPASVKIFRILCDTPWNHGGARNLALFNTTKEWVMWTDIDHIITPEELNKVLTANTDSKHQYWFKRVMRDTGLPKNRHVETRLMTRAMWDSFGGFDESFSGHYAFADREFYRRIDPQSPPIELDIVLRLQSDDTNIQDHKTRGLVRKDGRDDAAWDQIIQWKKEHNIGIQTLKLPWIRVI